MADELTPKQARFVEEYLIDLNGKQAALRAGYAEKSAETQASRLLRNVKVLQAVVQAKAARSERTQIKADDVLRELALCGFSDIRRLCTWGTEAVEFIPSDQIDDEAARTIGEVSSVTVRGDWGEKITKKVKMHGKIEALTAIGRHLGMFIDKKEISGSLKVEGAGLSGLLTAAEDEDDADADG